MTKVRAAQWLAAIGCAAGWRARCSAASGLIFALLIGLMLTGMLISIVLWPDRSNSYLYDDESPSRIGGAAQTLHRDRAIRKSWRSHSSPGRKFPDPMAESLIRIINFATSTVGQHRCGGMVLAAIVAAALFSGRARVPVRRPLRLSVQSRLPRCSETVIPSALAAGVITIRGSLGNMIPPSIVMWSELHVARRAG